MMIVASELDDSTERIIRYLSGTYGVPINAATFSFYKTQDGRELIARTFTIPDSEGKPPIKTGTKRTVPTAAQMESFAEEAGVGDLYRQFKSALAPYFRVSQTKGGCGFQARSDGSLKVVFSLLPNESSRERGLYYQLYSLRLSEFAGVSEEQIKQALPSGFERYEYYPNAPADLKGFKGYIRSPEDVARIASLIEHVTTPKALSQ